MKRLSCLIIEDIEIDARILMNMLSELPLLYQADWASTATDALSRLMNQTYDLVFLDMRLPGLLGTELLRDMPQRPPVIVTTSYVEFAEPCYDFDVADFLMKPFVISRLQRSINRALTRNLTQAAQSVAASIFLPTNRRMQQFHFRDILFIEAHGAYTKIHGSQGITIVSTSISWLEAQLPTSAFMRVQKSFIINLHYLTAVEARCVWVGETKITVGTQYRDQLRQLIVGPGSKDTEPVLD